MLHWAKQIRLWDFLFTIWLHTEQNSQKVDFSDQFTHAYGVNKRIYSIASAFPYPTREDIWTEYIPIPDYFIQNYSERIEWVSNNWGQLFTFSFPGKLTIKTLENLLTSRCVFIVNFGHIFLTFSWFFCCWLWAMFSLTMFSGLIAEKLNKRPSSSNLLFSSDWISQREILQLTDDSVRMLQLTDDSIRT